VTQIASLCRQRRLTVATAESCTGGLLAAALTSVSGASSFFLGGIVCYSIPLKVALGVPAGLIKRHGAASPEVAHAMAQAVRTWADASVGIAISGAAGPLPDGATEPGNIFIACAIGDAAMTASIEEDLGRQKNRQAAAQLALNLLCEALAAEHPH